MEWMYTQSGDKLNLHCNTLTTYVCGHCGDKVMSDVGLHLKNPQNGKVCMCPGCFKPTYFDENGLVFPGVFFGNSVPNLPDEVEHVFEEARRNMSVGSFTSASLLCRKILMNVAVSHGEPAGRRFVDYLNFLENSDLITTKMRPWVDRIRQIGNEGTHEINQVTQEAAEEIMQFTEMFLTIVYDFPAR